MGSSPTVWRRWLAHELKRLREEAGLSRKEVSTALRCTTGKLHYIETAVVPPRTRDLEEILFDLYRVPQDHREHYLQAARNAKKKGWWEHHSETVPKWFSLYLGLEQGASEIYAWETQLLPGLLQTHAYATALMENGTAELGEEEIRRRVDIRMSRQKILEGDEPIRLWAVLDEAALQRNVGGAEVMREQLAHLLEMSQRPKVTLQVLPQRSGAHPGMMGSFSILGFPATIDSGVIYIEHRTGSIYLEQPMEIKEHQIAFEHLRLAALKPAQSRLRLQEIMEEYS
ncbi:helix-turn-helix domain-containing protein [Nocardiopsis changdeensis]|uniref:Helix-turn-helix domain-containing protein n=1 Tax=Nocardiopsis changdeensis TaxID=2831969 RepID=A0ABX8BE88_9ACTN|nr:MULTISPECIES: helix-turn-helix transcriptional regulator [Nocardiopsis]QUX20566.1 helix-turn-helix domain-containing protein [Nocardiopsis changdeensis]QYX36497.1 helix-turn-helix domain-containing protein [Nocardiopsis sp. MT53]